MCLSGMAFRMRTTETTTKLAATTIDVAKEIEEKTGVHAGFLENGCLTVAADENWLHECKQIHTVCVIVQFS